MKAFISYSHADEPAVKKLHKHLSVLRRNGDLQAWYDREILPGATINKSIFSELETAKIFFAVTSPDFLASNYCYEKEMARALELHADGEIYIIPIIAEPCDWQNSPLGNLKAVPKNGKPISEWTNENTAWLDVVGEIRRVIDFLSGTTTLTEDAEPQKTIVAPERKYRLKKDFDTIDRSDYREKAFEAINDYFKEAIAELDAVEGMKARFRKLSDIAFSCSIYNSFSTSGVAHLTVRQGSNNSHLGDISYAHKENDIGDTSNGWFLVEADEYELYLQHSNFSGYSHNDAARLTPKSAAQILWQEFIERAGVSYA